MVKFDSEGFVHIGGNHVEESKNGIMIYKGGYVGYVRHGFGVHTFEKFRKEEGYWKRGKREGSFIEEFVGNNYEETSIVHYKEGSCID